MDEQDDSTREEERINLITEIARDLQSEGILPKERIVLREARIKIAIRAYFALNDAYHRWRIEDGHNTQPPKIAALQSLCLMRLQPFKLLNQNDAQTIAEAKANEIFVVASAAALLGMGLAQITEENEGQYFRILDLLTAFECETIEPVIQDTNYQIKRNRSEYSLEILPEDKPKIDALITIFELLYEISKLRS